MAESSLPAGGSRREFLKTSSLAVAGGAALASTFAARSVHAGVDDALKVAVVGCGGRGTGAVRDALTSTGNCKLVAMADAFENRLQGSWNELKQVEEIKDKLDVTPERQFVGLDAYQQAINSGCDVVILATPPGFRPIHLAAAIAAGKHVFMEKPVATDAPGVRSVLASAAEAKKKGLGIGVGLQRRHQNVYLETMKRLHDGAIGDIILARAYWNGTTPWVRKREPGQSEMEYQVNNWYFFNWLSGDHIVEQHIHNLDVINWLKNGYPTKAQGVGGRQVRVGPEFGEIFDHHMIEFEYADGTKCLSECRHQEGTWGEVAEYAHGTKGKVNIGAGRIEGPNNWRFRGQDNAPYVQEHSDLYASIRAGSPQNEGENGAKSTMTAIFGRMATASGKALNWEECLNSQINLQPEQYTWDALPKPKVDPKTGLYPCAIPGISQVV
ncbi:MAG: Gfo/Idh/MocA family oxidoreductase [Pirellulales bacterium]